MHFTFVVEVDMERQQGKFESREALSTELVSILEGANPGSLEGENGGTYEATAWSVSEQEQPKRARRR